MLLTVDLASRNWAACLGEEGKIRRQFCTRDFPKEDDAVLAITHLFRPESKLMPTWLIIEDVPFAVGSFESAKDAWRLQGRLIERMKVYGQQEKLLFIQPMEWQKHHKVVRQGDEGYALCAREKFNYLPPNLIITCASDFTSLHGKERANVRGQYKKLMTDFVAAFLIYQWAFAVGEEKMLSAKSVQRYTR